MQQRHNLSGGLAGGRAGGGWLSTAGRPSQAQQQALVVETRRYEYSLARHSLFSSSSSLALPLPLPPSRSLSLLSIDTQTPTLGRTPSHHSESGANERQRASSVACFYAQTRGATVRRRRHRPGRVQAGARLSRLPALYRTSAARLGSLWVGEGQVRSGSVRRGPEARPRVVGGSDEDSRPFQM